MDSQQLKELAIEFLDSKILLVLLYAYMLAIVVFLVYSVLNYFRDYSRMRQRWIHLRSQLSEAEKERAHNERILR